MPEIIYTLRRSKRAKRMRLSVYHDGRVVVTVPHKFNEKKVDKLVQEKRDWIHKKVEFVKKIKKLAFTQYTKKDYITHKEIARKQVQDRVNYFDKIYKFKYCKITIRNQKTRWGSCSRKGNLSFNYKIIFLPSRYADYIIFHELCHLKEFNHSTKFWRLVGMAFSDYKQIRRALKQYGLSLS